MDPRSGTSSEPLADLSVDVATPDAGAEARAPDTDPGAEARAPDTEPAEVPRPPRQRWRLILARDAGLPEAPGLTGRDLADAWEAALDASGLPLVRPAGRARARIVFGAPVPGSMALERELADILLTELVAAWVVREGLLGHLPDGWRLIDIFDVWLGAPALAAQVAAADYRIDLGEADTGVVASAATALLAASSLSRQRSKGSATVTYDLRPLIVDVTVVDVTVADMDVADMNVADPGAAVVIRTRTLFHPALGTGRPEEVVAALGDLAGRVLEARTIVRERLILADELESARPAPGTGGVSG